MGKPQTATDDGHRSNAGVHEELLRTHRQTQLPDSSLCRPPTNICRPSPPAPEDQAMTITRVTDDPGITSTHALHCGKKHSWCGRRWLEAFLMRTAGWCGYCWWRDTARHTGQDQTSWSNLVGLRESWGRVEIPLGQASWTPSWGRANHGGPGDYSSTHRMRPDIRGRPIGSRGDPPGIRDETTSWAPP